MLPSTIPIVIQNLLAMIVIQERTATTLMTVDAIETETMIEDETTEEIGTEIAIQEETTEMSEQVEMTENAVLKVTKSRKLSIIHSLRLQAC